jgi:hypothetical protein
MPILCRVKAQSDEQATSPTLTGKPPCSYLDHGYEILQLNAIFFS